MVWCFYKYSSSGILLWTVRSHRICTIDLIRFHGFVKRGLNFRCKTINSGIFFFLHQGESLNLQFSNCSQFTVLWYRQVWIICRYNFFKTLTSSWRHLLEHTTVSGAVFMHIYCSTWNNMRDDYLRSRIYALLSLHIVRWIGYNRVLFVGGLAIEITF